MSTPFLFLQFYFTDIHINIVDNNDNDHQSLWLFLDERICLRGRGLNFGFYVRFLEFLLFFLYPVDSVFQITNVVCVCLVIYIHYILRNNLVFFDLIGQRDQKDILVSNYKYIYNVCRSLIYGIFKLFFSNIYII